MRLLLQTTRDASLGLDSLHQYMLSPPPPPPHTHMATRVHLSVTKLQLLHPIMTAATAGGGGVFLGVANYVKNNIPPHFCGRRQKGGGGGGGGDCHCHIYLNILHVSGFGQHGKALKIRFQTPAASAHEESGLRVVDGFSG